MVRLNKIYTRTGDEGLTGLGNGERRRKDDARVAAYGEVDELNSALGVARLHTGGEALARIEATLARAQNDLFDLGADLCVPPSEAQALRVTPQQASALEAAIDDLNAELSPLKSFVLPGGTPAAAHLHLARAICRRAERAIVHLAASEEIGAPVIVYINRLSDYLFVAARYANDRGAGDVLWIPGAHREAE
jgi:cob(I)alamin adenosyltransferase